MMLKIKKMPMLTECICSSKGTRCAGASKGQYTEQRAVKMLVASWFSDSDEHLGLLRRHGEDRGQTWLAGRVRAKAGSLNGLA